MLKLRGRPCGKCRHYSWFLFSHLLPTFSKTQVSLKYNIILVSDLLGAYTVEVVEVPCL